MRTLLKLAFFTAVLSAPWVSQAATPTSGTLSTTTRSLTFSGGPYVQPNAQGTCDAADPCDDYALTVDLPANYVSTNPGDTILIELTWSPQQTDLDLMLLNADGTTAGNSGNAPGTPEMIQIPAGQGRRTYTVRVIPFAGGGATATASIKLVSAAAAGAPPAPFTGIAPRYHDFVPPAPLGETAGEPSLGYNTTTKRAMYISGLQTLRATFPENLNPAQPEACEAQWDDVSYIVTKTASLDPILFTDQRTGRTFVSQLNSQAPPASPVLVGANSLFAYTDDDGANWTPGQLDAPNGSYDHQSVGAGPYPALLAPVLSNAINKGSAVYYCSQVGVDGLCARSDTGGLTFNRPTAAFGPLACGGIHGHVRVAPDGTVYLPNRTCGANQGVAVSGDAGTTWTLRKIPTSTPPPGILDPSIALAKDGTGYFCHVNADGHVHVAVTKDKGATWTNDADIGLGQGIQNAVFVEAIAGDANRAACGFVGTTTAGNHQALDFPGVWYVFMAHTYDGGKNWVTVNATPGDPVQQKGGIWNQGGSSPNRNLLDFNEITLDEKGRVLYSYSDGCVGDCVPNGPNSYTQKAGIARQSGGKSLFAAMDVTEPTAPQRACLAGRRDDTGSFLRWSEPDTGGATISGYKVFRSLTPGGAYEQVGATAGKAAFVDRSADINVAKYSYKVVAVNSGGESALSNLVELPIGPRPVTDGPCVLPGVLAGSDPTGDATTGLAAHDIQSISVAEPQNLSGKIVFTMKVASLAQLPPGFRWAVRFKPPATPPADPATGAAQEDFFVSMVTSDNATASFTYGTTGSPNTNVPARFFTTIGNLDAASGFNANGTITMILDKSKIGSPKPVDQIINILGSVRATAPSAVPGTGGVNQTIPDTTGGASYTLRTANLCLPNIAPIARLAATNVTGGSPLTVQFNAAGSSDADVGIDTIAKYAFNFGDGSEEVEQTGPTISHTYTQASGVPYIAKLVVTDSRGKLSSNVDQQVVTVNKAGTSSSGGTLPVIGGVSPTTSTPQATGRFGGGALGLGVLPLFCMALRRRRRH